MASCVKSEVGLVRSPSTALGVEAYNISRRPSSTSKALAVVFRRRVDESSNKSIRSTAASSSSSSTSSLAHYAVPNDERVVEARRQAGAGSVTGLGLLRCRFLLCLPNVLRSE